MAFNPLEWLKVGRAIDRLLTLETKHTGLLEAHAKEVQALKDRVTRLETREEIVIGEAKAAAAVAASALASNHLATLAQQVGALNERTRRLRGLPSPDSGPSV